MYRLYDMNIRKLLDASYQEKDIIDTLCELVKENTNFRYLIVKHDEKLNMDEAYKGIKSVSDYYMYVKDYQRRTLEQQKSCLELKREILDKKDKRRR